MILTFGIHKGEDIEDVPSDYLQWVVSHFEPPPVGHSNRAATLDMISACEDELASRKKYGDKP
jgi:uncharacterized protein (DUF3820 family)